jgi:protein-S-isoprenylcysteine O-methyltransferase Ste14
MLAATALTALAQLQMGDSWRIGVDPRESTALVTHGLFRAVRNPIFSAMGMAVLGLALVIPNALSFLGFALVALGLELHVRGAEEPYLLRLHGERYRAYAARVGRFLPGVGRLRSPGA